MGNVGLTYYSPSGVNDDSSPPLPTLKSGLARAECMKYMEEAAYDYACF